jgi:atypical dual specificity phosphatase
MDPFIYTVDMGRVGGRPAPGREPWDLAAIRRAGFTVIVSFECDRIDEDEIRGASIEHYKFCVEDFTAPTLDQLREFNELCDRKTSEGKKVLAHCWAGRGRTGTFLASRLIWKGTGAADAIAEVRQKILKTQRTLAGAIESSQEAALFAFERTRRPEAKRA